MDPKCRSVSVGLEKKNEKKRKKTKRSRKPVARHPHLTFRAGARAILVGTTVSHLAAFDFFEPPTRGSLQRVPSPPQRSYQSIHNYSPKIQLSMLPWYIIPGTRYLVRSKINESLQSVLATAKVADAVVACFFRLCFPLKSQRSTGSG